MFSKLKKRWSIAMELLSFMAGKRLCLVPFLLGLLALTFLVSLAQTTNVTPFIYTIF